MQKNYNLRPVWDAILNIYATYTELCKKYGLRYYIINGTAIGAVRHHGFIPWDDDFDVAMPREDYEKFRRIVKELPPHLKFVDWHNTKEYTQLFGKIQDSRREVVESIERETGFMLSNGIFIDVFPIDGFPSNPIMYYLYKVKYQIIKAVIRFRLHSFKEQTKAGVGTWCLGMFCGFFWPFRWSQPRLFTAIEKFAKSCPFATSKNTGRVDSSLTFRYVYDKSVWGSPQYVSFENINVPIPQKIDEYLRLEYGNYMQLPPETKRTPNHGYSWRCSWWLGPTNDNF